MGEKQNAELQRVQIYRTRCGENLSKKMWIVQRNFSEI